MKLKVLLIGICSLTFFGFGSTKTQPKKVASLSQEIQRGTIHGQVLDESNEPLIGASVESSEGMGVSADDKGKFSLENVAVGTELEVSFMGYESPKIKIKSLDDFVTIKMKESKTTLTEIIVVRSYSTESSGKIEEVEEIEKLAESKSWILGDFRYGADSKSEWLDTHADHAGYLLKEGKGKDLIIILSEGYLKAREEKKKHENYLVKMYKNFLEKDFYNKDLQQHLTNFDSPSLLFIPNGDLMGGVFPIDEIKGKIKLKKSRGNMEEVINKNLKEGELSAFAIMFKDRGCPIENRLLKNIKEMRETLFVRMMTISESIGRREKK